MSQNNPFDDLKSVVEHMRHAESVAEKVLGEESQHHLREAASHIFKAARHSFRSG